MKQTGAIMITTDAVGGVWTYSLALAKGFTDAGWQVLLAVLGPAADAEQQAAAEAVRGCTLIHTHLPMDWLAGSATELRMIAERLAELAHDAGVQRVHLHAPTLATADWRLPVVLVVHSCMTTWWQTMRTADLPEAFVCHKELSQTGLHRASAVIAPSQSFARDLHRAYGASVPVHVVHNGTEKRVPAKAARQDFILIAGRLWDEGKNVETLDRASAHMRSQIRAAGPIQGPNGATAALARLELLDTLPAPFLRVTMARAAAFAASSRYEPFGLAVLEAADLATPLVLADIPSFRELWQGAAQFVLPTDHLAWAATLDNLVEDKIARAAWGAAAQKRAARYTQARMVAKTLAVHGTVRNAAMQAA